jgi:putative DNA primase/helicase
MSASGVNGQTARQEEGRPFRDDDETKPPRAIECNSRPCGQARINRIGLGQEGHTLGKMMLGPVADCAVKLDADDVVEQGLGVTEGIETAMRVRARGWRPVWALGSAGAIAKFAPIAGIETRNVFADHDANGVGMAAAKQCAQAWHAAGCEVFIRTPHSVGADWLDVQP